MINLKNITVTDNSCIYLNYFEDRLKEYLQISALAIMEEDWLPETKKVYNEYNSNSLIYNIHTK